MNDDDRGSESIGVLLGVDGWRATRVKSGFRPKMKEKVAGVR